MSSETQHKRAQEIFDRLCEAVDAKRWPNKKAEGGELSLSLDLMCAAGPIWLCFDVNEVCELVTLLVPIPSRVRQENRAEMAMAVNMVNRVVPDGCFNFRLDSGRVFYWRAISYLGCEPGRETFQEMVEDACLTVALFRERFVDLARGRITLERFADLF